MDPTLPGPGHQICLLQQRRVLFLFHVLYLDPVPSWYLSQFLPVGVGAARMGGLNFWVTKEARKNEVLKEARKNEVSKEARKNEVPVFVIVDVVIRSIETTCVLGLDKAEEVLFELK